MVDREKVIKGLERCKLYNKVNCDKCPYDYNGRGNGESECTAELASDALALLKERESVIEALKSDLDETLAVLGEQPDIVRCRDCKYWRTNTEFCMCWSVANAAHHTNPNWFCINGERR